MDQIPHDPDFDASPGGGGKTFFEALSPKSALVVGLAGGFLALCTIGFFILLSMVLRGSVSLGKNDTGSAPAQPTAPVAAAPGNQPSGPVPPVTSDDHIRGSSGAKVTLVEYSDFECPFCKRFHPTLLQVMQNYSGQVRWIFRHYPLSFHANAQKEAEASECAAELGGNDAFWSYADKVFERTAGNGTGFPLANLAPLAKELGLNEAKFKQCLDSGKYAQKVAQQMSSGQAAGVQGTPGTFVVGKDGSAELIPGALPYEQVKAIIDAKL